MKVASPKLCGECTSRSQMWITQQARYLPPRLQKHLPSFLLPSECYSFPATPKWEDIKELNLQFVSTLHSLSFFFFFSWNTTGPCLWSEWKVTQSCLTLCDPMDYRVHGILQARILEWVAFPFSRGSSQPRNRTQVSHIEGGFFNQLNHKGSSDMFN